jgi:hypothetical protein
MPLAGFIGCLAAALITWSFVPQSCRAPLEAALPLMWDQLSGTAR